MGRIARVVAVGASNLTFGLGTVVGAARGVWGPDVQVLAALGHGRSYGAPSRVLVRTLPGILECGLWRTLEALPPVPTRALVTDVGNDILYGVSAAQILAWVDEVLRRLRRVTPDVTLTTLPPVTGRSLSRAKYVAFRALFFPGCRLPLVDVLDSVESMNSGLAALAGAHQIRLLPLDPAWYGVDPIHIRRAHWRTAWQMMLNTPKEGAGDRCSAVEALRLTLMAPERRWILGKEQRTPQSGAALPRGGRVWLY